MNEQNRDIGIRTHSEDADDYIKQLQKEMEELSDEKKVSILLNKIRYWYWSAIDWRNFYEIEIERRKEI